MTERTGPSEHLEDFLPYQLSVASNAVSARIAEQYRSEFGLKMTEWRIMAVLGDGEPLTQRRLVGLTLLDKVAVNRACKVLEDRGLLSRAPNREDGRSHLLTLSETGRAIHSRVMPLARAIESELFAEFSNEERAQLHTLLKRIRARATGEPSE